MEQGATRNIQAQKLLEEEEKRVQNGEDEERNDPMKVLKSRTKDSRLEMEVLENLQELKELSERHANVDLEAMLQQHGSSEQQKRQPGQEEDQREMEALLEQAQGPRLKQDSAFEEEPALKPSQLVTGANPTAFSEGVPRPKKHKLESWRWSVGALGSKSKLAGLVVARKAPTQRSSSSSRGHVVLTAPNTGITQALREANVWPRIPGASSLSQLGTYSDSEDSS